MELATNVTLLFYNRKTPFRDCRHEIWTRLTYMERFMPTRRAYLMKFLQKYILDTEICNPKRKFALMCGS